MIHDVDAIYDHGVLRPVVPLALPEGARVHLRAEPSAKAADTVVEPLRAKGNSLLDRLKDVVGSIDDLPDDSSTNLDNYLYGRPKQ